MIRRSRIFYGSFFLFLFLIGSIFIPFISAAVVEVPKNQPTLQAAVNAAGPGDTIRLSPGRHCGAFVSKRLEITGEGAVIIGCDSPKHPSGFKVGLWLSRKEASGSKIHHLTFDGQGVSNSNLDPLGAAIFSRDLINGNDKINDVEISHIKVLGTVQAITNNGGDNWNIHHNVIENLSVFDCQTGAKLCGGGVGIVAQLWRGAVVQSQLRSRPQNNTIAHNAISGQIPDSLTLFSMSGIFLLNADNTAVENNKTSIPDNPTTPSAGVGIWLTNQCCGDSSFDPGSQNNILINNDGRGSEFALIVDPDNTQGLTLRGNLGLNLIGDEAKQVKNRSIKTFQEFPQAQVQGQASTPELLIERSQLPKELKARLLTQLAHLMGPGSHIAPPDEPKVFAANQGGVLHFTDFTFVESPAVNPVSIGDLALGIQEPGSDEVLDFADAPGTIIAETDVVEVSPDGSQVSHYQCRLKRLASQALFQRFSLVNVSGDARSDMRSDSFLASSGEPLNFGLGCGEGSFVVASTTPLEGTYGMWLFYRAPGQSIPVQADVNIGDPTGTVVGQAVLHYTINPGQEIHLASVTVGGASGDIAHEVDDDKQFGEDVDWAGEFVGNGTGENQMFRNIGCAVVTVSNILRFYGFDVNPLTLNNGLKEADAFDGADLIFPKIPAYTDTQDRPFHYTRIDQPTNEQVDLELKEQPVIVKVYSIGTSDKTHFLVIKGKQGETYAINDPGNSDIETLTEYFNRISDPLKRKIISLRVLTPESGDSSSVNILGRSPIELLLIDSLGRKTGFDPLASSLVTQIPGAAYESDTSLGDDTGEGNDEERFAYLELTPAPPGLYSIQVVGTGEGSYHLNLINTDSNAQTSLDTQFSGLTMAGKIDVYQVSYSPIPGQPSSVIKTVSFQSLEIDLRLARQLNLIDNDGILKSLIQKLENARKARENQRIGSWSRLAATL